jgi:hypothetical protein
MKLSLRIETNRAAPSRHEWRADDRFAAKAGETGLWV